MGTKPNNHAAAELAWLEALPKPAAIDPERSAKYAEFRNTLDNWFDMNMTDAVVRNWPVSQGQDEFIQNFQDQCQVMGGGGANNTMGMNNYSEPRSRRVGVVPVEASSRCAGEFLLLAKGRERGFGAARKFWAEERLGMLHFVRTSGSGATGRSGYGDAAFCADVGERGDW